MNKYPIKPSDIDTSKHFYDVFENNETENSANWLVKLAQKNGDWRNFTKNEIDEFYNEFFKGEFCFNELLGNKINNYRPIETNEDNSFSFTHRFISRCFLASPAEEVVV